MARFEVRTVGRSVKRSRGERTRRVSLPCCSYANSSLGNLAWTREQDCRVKIITYLSCVIRYLADGSLVSKWGRWFRVRRRLLVGFKRFMGTETCVSGIFFEIVKVSVDESLENIVCGCTTDV